MKKSTILLAFYAMLISANSYGQSLNPPLVDTIFTQCISGQDTVLRILPENVQSSVTAQRWQDQNGVICYCDSVVIPKTSGSNIYSYFFTINSVNGNVTRYVINQPAQISVVDTTSNCTIEFTSVPHLSYAVWSGVSGYTTNTDNYVITSGQPSGYIYLSLECGVKLDSIHYNGCSTDTTPVTTGVEDINKDEISIYPNPFSDKITITPSFPYQMFDVLGKLVYDSKEKEFPSDLPKGCYVLKSPAFNKIVVKQ